MHRLSFVLIGDDEKEKEKKGLEMLGFEPRTFCMQSRCSTTELHPRSHKNLSPSGVVDAPTCTCTCILDNND